MDASTLPISKDRFSATNNETIVTVLAKLPKSALNMVSEYPVVESVVNIVCDGEITITRRLNSSKFLSSVPRRSNESGCFDVPRHLSSCSGFSVRKIKK